MVPSHCYSAINLEYCFHIFTDNEMDGGSRKRERKRQIVAESVAMLGALSSRMDICLVCSSPQAASPHFGTVSCLACAAFFRRTVALNITFTCKKDNNCPIYYELRMICRACRYDKCIKAGMKRQCVQKRRSNKKEKERNGRDTMCGVKKELRESVSEDEERYGETLKEERGEEREEGGEREEQTEREEREDSEVPPAHSSSVDSSFTDDDISASASTSFATALNPTFDRPFALPGMLGKGASELLQHFIQEERKAMDRRRMMFTVNPLIALTHSPGTVPYMRAGLVPHTLRAQVENVKFDHVLAYEYCRAMPGLHLLSPQEKLLLMRTVALGFSITDMGYISATVINDDEHILVFTDGSYSTCGEGDFSVGWEDEDLISQEDKKKLFLEFNKRFFSAIIRPMRECGLDQVEHAALKALCTWKLGYYEYTNNMRTLGKEIDEAILAALSHYYKGRADASIRLGNLVLMMGNLFEMFRIVTDMYKQLDFFNLLHLDSISSALLNI